MPSHTSSKKESPLKLLILTRELMENAKELLDNHTHLSHSLMFLLEIATAFLQAFKLLQFQLLSMLPISNITQVEYSQTVEPTLTTVSF